MPSPLLSSIDHAVLTRAKSSRKTRKVRVSAHDRDAPSRLLARYEQLDRWDRLERLLTLILTRSARCGTTSSDIRRLHSLSLLADDSLTTLRPARRRTA